MMFLNEDNKFRQLYIRMVNMVFETVGLEEDKTQIRKFIECHETNTLLELNKNIF